MKREHGSSFERRGEEGRSEIRRATAEMLQLSQEKSRQFLSEVLLAKFVVTGYKGIVCNDGFDDDDVGSRGDGM